MKILPMKPNDLSDWVTMSLKLWPGHSQVELTRECSEILKSQNEQSYIVRDETGNAIAFINLSLRFDYVPGSTRSPVAYVEGIFVEEQHRHLGIAKQLIRQAEKWAQERHCTELASDTLIENTESRQFHLKVGFKEVERIVAFIKPLERYGL
jgi:aminoglycoside 6'-N-acetyltransferase I